MALLCAALLNGVSGAVGAAHPLCNTVTDTKANCADKFLISAKLNGLPFTLKNLNLDRNQISVLENQVFMVRDMVQDIHSTLTHPFYMSNS